MSSIQKVKQEDYQLTPMQQISGRIFLCTPKNKRSQDEQYIAKRIMLINVETKELETFVNKFTGIQRLYIILPNKLWEDRKENCAYILMPKMYRSTQDVIQVHKRQGKLIPIEMMKVIVDNTIRGLKLIHEIQQSHGHIKPSNILYDKEENEYNLSDLGVFSCDTSDVFLSPEQIQKKNIQKPNDPQKSDIFCLGFSLLILATLKKPQELSCFNDPPKNIDKDTITNKMNLIKKQVQKNYSESFINLIDAMINSVPSQRKNIIQLQSFADNFQKIPNTDLDSSSLQPDTEIIFDDIKGMLIGRNLKLKDYFMKYEMNAQNDKISVDNFFQSLEDLQMNLSKQEKNALELQFDPKETGDMDLSLIIRQEATRGIQVVELKGKDEQKLKQLLNDLKNFIEKENIDLIGLFREIDKDFKHYLTDKEFKQFMDKEFKIKDTALLEKRYDPGKKGFIYYDFLCDDIGVGEVSGDNKGYEDIISQIYNTIRQKYSTFKAFYTKYKQSNRSFMEVLEFIEFLEDEKINPSPKIMSEINDNIVDGNKITNIKFKTLFEDLVDQEIKSFIIRIIQRLEDEDRNFLELCKINKNGEINQDKLYDALRSIKIDLKRSDLQFLLEDLKVIQSDNIDYEELSVALIQRAQKLDIKKNLKLLGGNKQKKQSNFDDDDDNNNSDNDDDDENINYNDENQDFSGCRPLLREIMKGLDIKRLGPQTYFPEKMDKQEFKEKCKGIGVDVGQFSIEYKELIEKIKNKRIPSKVDGQVLAKALHLVSRTMQQSKQVDLSKKINSQTQNQIQTVQVQQYIHLIKQAMISMDMDEQIFKDLDRKNDQIIRKADFERLLTGELELDVSDKKYKKLIQFIEEDQKFLILPKLLRLLKDDDQASELLQSLNFEFQKNKQLDTDDVFQNYDKNKNDRLEFLEFQTLVMKILKDHDEEPNEKIIKVLFMQLDTNCDDTISIKEFHKQIKSKGTTQSKNQKEKKRKYSDSDEDIGKSKIKTKSQNKDDQKNKQTKIKISQIDETFDQLVNLIVKYMDDNFQSLLDIYQECLKNQNSMLSFDDFYNRLIKRLLKQDYDSELAEHIFQQMFDTDKDLRISKQEFTDAIYKRNQIKPNKIQVLKQLILGDKDISISNDLQHIFDDISNSKTEFKFGQLCKYIRQIESKINILELDQLFQAFDNNSKGKIDKQTFILVMQEGMISKSTSMKQSVQQGPMQVQVIQYIMKIKQSLDGQGNNIKLFKDLINKDGSISIIDFKNVIENELQLDMNDGYQKLIEQIRDKKDSNIIEPHKLLKLFEDDDLANQMLKSLNLEFQSNEKLVLDKIFEKFDQNKSEVLELPEFRNLIKNLLDDSETKNPRIIDVLFMKLDVNCDGAIQYRELHAKISEKISKDSVKKSKKQDGKNNKKQDVESDENSEVDTKEIKKKKNSKNNKKQAESDDSEKETNKKSKSLKNKKKQVDSDDSEGDKKQSKKKFGKREMEKCFDEIIEQIVYFMDRKSYSSSAIFERCNKQGKQFLSFGNFYKDLFSLIEFECNEQLAEQIFYEIFDMDKDMRLSYFEFKEAIFLRNPINVNKIQQLKSIILDGKDIKKDRDLQSIFNIINNNNNNTKTFSFPQFVKYIRQREPKVDILEIDFLFQSFDYQNKGNIDQQIFIKIMKENEQNLKNPMRKTESFVMNKETKNQQKVQQENNIFQRNKRQIKEQDDENDIDDDEFDPYKYEKQIKQQIDRQKLDVFDIFYQFDKSDDCEISTVQDLENIFKQLDIQASPQYILNFYQHYTNQNQQMRYLRLCIRFGLNPGKLLAKTLNYSILKVEHLNPKSLWDQIANEKNVLKIDQFKDINEKFNLEFGPGEIQEAFNYWDTANKKYINFEQYSQMLSKFQIQEKPKQNKQKQLDNNVGEDQILSDFLDDLSSLVNSKACFNLYEECDKENTDQILIGDFQKQTEIILEEKIQTKILAQFRKKYSTDGYINLQDLANALKIQLQEDGRSGHSYNIQVEKKQFGLNQAKGKIQKQRPTEQQFQFILQIIKDFLKNRNNKGFDFIIDFYFPSKGPSLLDKGQFIKKTKELQISLNESQSEQLYDYIDVNGSGQISINEFLLVFPRTQNVVRQIENLAVSKEIDDEIKELFKKVDSDGSNKIEKDELRKVLQSFGINPSKQELESYMQQFDKNGRGYIEYEEFNIIIKNMIQKEMLQSQDLLDELRKQFRVVCNSTTRTLSQQQMKQVFRNLSIVIAEDDLQSLFEEIDQDNSDSIDIDEFIYFIQKNQSGLSAKASAAIMNIKGARRISLNDLRDIFTQMPKNFILSFIIQNTSKNLNQIASTLKPKLDSSGLYYQDLNYIESNSINLKQSVLTRQNVKNNFCFEIKLIECNGIPISKESDASRQSFIRREVGFILWDKVKETFIGNCAFIQAQWKQDTEDKWSFPGDPIDNTIILRWGNFDSRIDSNTEIILEMITYTNQKGQVVPLSCCHANIEIQSIVPGEKRIALKGGAPSREIVINKEDVRTNRTGWGSKMLKALSSPIKSEVILEINKISNPDILKQISILPNISILNKWALNLWKGFREYYAYRTVQVQSEERDLNIGAESSIKAWINLINCPDSYKPFAQCWNTHIEQNFYNLQIHNNRPKCKSYQFQIDAARTIGENSYLMFLNQDFKFKVKSSLNDPTLMKKRIEIINNTIDEEMEIRILLNIPYIFKSKTKSKINYTNLDPYNITESLDQDDDEDEMAQINKFIEKKFKKSQNN